MPDNDLLIEKSDGIATVTINRPHRMNAVTSEMIRQTLPKMWADLAADKKVRVVVFTAAGDRAFCSGMDVKEAATSPDWGKKDNTPSKLLMTAWQNKFPKPVITAVNGLCGGGGLMFVSDSDITIAADTATFFNPGVTVGQLATVGPITWTRWMPFQALMRMMLVGASERISAQRALDLGIVTEVVPAASLLARAKEIAGMVGRNSPTAVRLVKRSLWEAMELGLTEAHANGSKIIREYMGHPDTIEGPRAFAEKRPPHWVED